MVDNFIRLSTLIALKKKRKEKKLQLFVVHVLKYKAFNVELPVTP